MTTPNTGRPVFIWPALVAIVFTLVMLQWSFDRFRLASPPFVDDASWLNEGIAMRDAMRDGGISGFVHHIAETKTLAPYSIVAAAGFAVVSDGTDTLWDAPYGRWLPAQAQRVFFLLLAHAMWAVRPFYPWSLGENYVCLCRKEPPLSGAEPGSPASPVPGTS